MDPSKTHPYLKITCHGCPTQIEGDTPDGNSVYFRYRWGRAVVEINDRTVWGEQLSDDLDGVMDPDTALRITCAVVDLHEAVQSARRAQQPDTDTD